jgi:hypothetical protein
MDLFSKIVSGESNGSQLSSHVKKRSLTEEDKLDGVMMDGLKQLNSFKRQRLYPQTDPKFLVLISLN